MGSIGSGEAALGVANSGGRGKLSSRALELSNVDITDQFTELIVTERGYQANSRVITTTDNIMQEALRLKQ
jgi:flagellar hook protein FlgE